MIRHFLATALLAGLLTGLVATGLQQATTAPLIQRAEQFEAAGAAIVRGDHHKAEAEAPASHAHDRAAWAPADGAERLLFTALANVIAGIGFAFLLVAAFMFRGERTSGRTGVLWGLVGFAVFTLAPSFGLPPELPTMSAAGLFDRQTWWIATATATAAGLWLMILPGATLAQRVGKPVLAAIGIAVVALPHIVGAPHPPIGSAQVPPELAAQFAVASIGNSAVFWVCLGWLAGTLYGRKTLGAVAGDNMSSLPENTRLS
jgi:cobalt transporter subunit CbtA